VSAKIIAELTAQRIAPTFSHTIKDMIYDVVLTAAKVGSSYDEFVSTMKKKQPNKSLGVNNTNQ
jgi:hypothetical protein